MKTVCSEDSCSDGDGRMQVVIVLMVVCLVKRVIVYSENGFSDNGCVVKITLMKILCGKDGCIDEDNLM